MDNPSSDTHLLATNEPHPEPNHSGIDFSPQSVTTSECNSTQFLIDNSVETCETSASSLPSTHASARSTIKPELELVQKCYKTFRRVLYFICFFPEGDTVPDLGVKVETRYNGILANILAIMNVCGTILIMYTIISAMTSTNFFGTLNTLNFHRFAGIAHLVAVVVIFICTKLVTPPAIHVETGMPVIFPYMYGLFLGTAQLIIAARRDTCEAWCYAEALLIIFGIGLLINLNDTFKRGSYDIDLVLVEVAKRDYGAFDLEFFKQLQAEYTGPSQTCPVWVEGDSLYVKESGQVQKIEGKMESEFVKSPLSRLWNAIRGTSNKDPEPIV